MDDGTRNLFCLFCSTWRAALKMFVRLFRIKASEIVEKVQQKLFTRNKNGETETKRIPKLQEIVTTAPIVFHRYERLAVLQNVLPLFCFE